MGEEVNDIGAIFDWPLVAIGVEILLMKRNPLGVGGAGAGGI